MNRFTLHYLKAQDAQMLTAAQIQTLRQIKM